MKGTSWQVRGCVDWLLHLHLHVVRVLLQTVRWRLLIHSLLEASAPAASALRG